MITIEMQLSVILSELSGESLNFAEKCFLVQQLAFLDPDGVRAGLLAFHDRNEDEFTRIRINALLMAINEPPIRNLVEVAQDALDDDDIEFRQAVVSVVIDSLFLVDTKKSRQMLVQIYQYCETNLVDRIMRRYPGGLDIIALARRT